MEKCGKRVEWLWWCPLFSDMVSRRRERRRAAENLGTQALSRDTADLGPCWIVWGPSLGHDQKRSVGVSGLEIESVEPG